MGRVGRQLTDAIKAATGERIVAFGRAGKSPENPFLRPISHPGPSPERCESPLTRNGFLRRVA